VFISYNLVRTDLTNSVKTEPITLLAFSFPLFLSGVTGLILNWIDTVSIGYFLGSADVGIYQSAYLLGTTIGLIQSVVGTSLYPNFGTLLAEGRFQTLQERYQWGVKLITILTMAPAMYLIIFSDHSLLIIFGESYAEASTALTIVAIGQYISVSIGPATVLLKSLKSTNYILITTALAVVLNAVLNFTLIPNFGFAGAAIATGTSSALLNILHFWKARKKILIKLPVQDVTIAGIIAASISIVLKLVVGTVSDPLLFFAHVVFFSFLYVVSINFTSIIKYTEVKRILIS
jgi:O-antigen/teichoic acid export membrane protein